MTSPSLPPGAAPYASTWGSLPGIRIAGPASTFAATLHGAHLLEWNLPDAPPVLFLSPQSDFTDGKPIRGGVPLAFPWFGPKADDPHAPVHGFARLRSWRAERCGIDDAGVALADFALTDDAAMREQWPHAFAARFSIRAGRELRMALEVANTSTSPCTFQAALHTYFAVSDVRQIAIGGLEDTEYLDKTEGFRRQREGTAPVRITSETDRVYLDTTATCAIRDPGWKRVIHIAKSGSRSTVVWNPWSEKARKIADLGESNWTGFVCVETTNALADAVTLAPGARHTLAAEISVSALA